MRMIQPVSASNPRASFRGTRKTYGDTSKSGISNAQIALINAGGVAAAVGATTTIISRRYTPSWAYAAMVGLCSSFLTMFFMTPQVIEKSGKAFAGHQKETEAIAKKEGSKFAKTLKERFKPNRKAIPFKQG